MVVDPVELNCKGAGQSNRAYPGAEITVVPEAELDKVESLK